MKLRLLYIAFLLVSLTSETKADNLGYTKENPLIFGIDIDYPPLQYVDEVGLPKGFDVVVTNKLMKRSDKPAFLCSLNISGVISFPLWCT